MICECEMLNEMVVLGDVGYVEVCSGWILQTFTGLFTIEKLDFGSDELIESIWIRDILKKIIQS